MKGKHKICVITYHCINPFSIKLEVIDLKSLVIKRPRLNQHEGPFRSLRNLCSGYGKGGS